MTLTCGIDVGGTKIAGGLVDEDGNVVKESRVESPATDPAEVLDAIADLVRELASDHEIAAVGVGAAGLVDVNRATVLFAPNIAWRDEDLRTGLMERLDLAVIVENDANAAAWGEFQFGAGAEVDDLLLVTVGTGIGGGIVLDGVLHRGAFGVAAEIGHIRFERAGRLCGCGNLGCWEKYASGSALTEGAIAQAKAGSLLAKDLVERAGGDPEEISGPLITEAAQDGDPFALAQIRKLGQYLGEGIATLAAVLDPKMVVIGGGVSAAEDMLLDPLRETFAENLTGRTYRPQLEIRTADLGNRAGVIGAADLARRD